MNFNNYSPYRTLFFSLTTLMLCAILILTLISLYIGTGSLYAESGYNFLLKLRFYRIITAFLCGGMLALGSAILQTATKNPMIAPDLTGMTSIGCLLIIISQIFFTHSAISNVVLGIIGASLGFIFCFILSYKNNNRTSLIINGIALSFSASALMQIIILKAPREVENYITFLAGSLYATSFETCSLILTIATIVIPAALIFSRKLSVLTLDTETSKSLGTPIAIYIFISFFLASLLIGTSIIGIGNMGFLGIVAPNLVRIFVGNRSNYLFFLTFLIGGFIYLLADTIGRHILSGSEIPAGIMSNIISAPIFLIILYYFYREPNGKHFFKKH